MKNNYKQKVFLLCISLLLLFAVNAFAQKNASCGFSLGNSENLNSRVLDGWHVNTCNYTDENDYCINIIVHIVNNQNNQGVNSTIVEQEMNDMISIFSNHGINLQWDGISSINPISDINLHNQPQLAFNNPTHSNPNKIDIYFFNSFAEGYNSESSTISTDIIIRPEQLSKEILAHEMGHQFGLFHTYHGTWNCSSLPVCENNDGFNDIPEVYQPSNTFTNCEKGDWVADTIYDDGGIIDSDGGEQCLTINDESGLVMDPSNYMTNSFFPSCRNNFTNGQVTRMKYFLNNATAATNPILPHLALAIQDCPAPDICSNDCKSAKNAAEDIFFGYEEGSFNFTPLNFTSNPNGYSFSISDFSTLTTDCNLTYEISYDGGSSFHELVPAYGFPTDGTDTTTIENNDGRIQLRVTNHDNEVEDICCFSVKYGDTDKSDIIECGTSDPCDDADCASFVNTIDINADLQPSQTNPCVYTLNLAPQSNCFKVSIDWGDGTIENIDLIAGNVQIDHTYTTNIYAVTLTVSADDDSCQQTLTSNSFDVQCGPICYSCNDLARTTIAKSIQEHASLGCSYTINVPDLMDGCWSGTVDWGDGTIDPLVEGNMSYTYLSSGTYTVTITIHDSYGNLCTVETETVSIDCSNDNCPEASCLDIITNPNLYCSEASVWMNCNDTEIDFIKWYYTLSGSYVHQYFGTSYGNPNGQHSQPLYLPSPPSFSGSWDGYILTVYAETYIDGIACDEISTNTRLSCSSGGGGPLFKAKPNKDIKISLSRNPVKPNQELAFKGINYKDIIGIEVLDILGNRKITLKPTKNSLSVRKLPSGLYFIRFTTKYGIQQKKLIIK